MKNIIDLGGDEMEFSNEEEFYATLNQWVRDGSNITGFYSSMTSDGVVYVVRLTGPDGAKEELTLEVM